jgi:hypothetical protein
MSEDIFKATYNHDTNKFDYLGYEYFAFLDASMINRSDSISYSDVESLLNKAWLSTIDSGVRFVTSLYELNPLKSNNAKHYSTE